MNRDLITVERVMKWGPCNRYTEERVRKYLGEGKTPLECLKLRIPFIDRIWLVAFVHPDASMARLYEMITCIEADTKFGASTPFSVMSRIYALPPGKERVQLTRKLSAIIRRVLKDWE